MFTPFRAEDIGRAAEAMGVFAPSDVPQIPGIASIYNEAYPTPSVFPNLIIPTDTQGFPVISVWPLGINQTRMDLHWFGVDWGDGDRPAGWETKFAAWDQLMAEDIKNLEPIQASIECAAHGGVPLNYQERKIWHFHAEIDRTIGPAAIPEHLRVPDLVSHYVED
jgi:choline monooxygenase